MSWIAYSDGNEDEYEEMQRAYTVPAYLKDKTCPCCGSQYILPDYLIDETTPNRFYWYCLKCGASEETLYPDWDSALENWSYKDEQS